jgi:hypothetical protein
MEKDNKKKVMNDMVSVKKTVIKKPVIQPAPAPRRILEPVRPRPAPIRTAPIVEEEESVYIPERSTKNRAGCLLWFVAIICCIALISGIGGLFTHATLTLVPKQFNGSVDTTISLSQTHDPNTVFFGTATKVFTSEKVVPATSRALNETKATGIVRFSSTNTVAKTIPAKTEITSIGVKNISH